MSIAEIPRSLSSTEKILHSPTIPSQYSSKRLIIDEISNYRHNGIDMLQVPDIAIDEPRTSLTRPTKTTTVLFENPVLKDKPEEKDIPPEDDYLGEGNGEKFKLPPNYAPFLRAFLGIMFHSQHAALVTGVERPIPESFIKYCNKIESEDNPYIDSMLADEHIVPKLLEAVEQMKEQLDAISNDGRYRVWYSEVSATQSPFSTKQLKVLLSDPDILEHVKKLGFTSIDEYAKNLIQDRDNPKYRSAETTKKVTLPLEELELPEKLRVLNTILTTYDQYDYGNLTAIEASMAINARADLIGFSCDPNDAEAIEVVGSLEQALKHNLHSLASSTARTAPKLYGEHLEQLKKAAQLIWSGRIQCDIGEVKCSLTTAPPDYILKNTIGEIEDQEYLEEMIAQEHVGESRNLKFQFDKILPLYEKDVAHTVLALTTLFSSLLRLADQSTLPPELAQAQREFTNLLTVPREQRLQSFDNSALCITHLLRRQKFYLMHFNWPVIYPLPKKQTTPQAQEGDNFIAIHEGEVLSGEAKKKEVQLFDFDQLLVRTTKPEVRLVELDRVNLARFVARRGLRIIDKWILKQHAAVMSE